MILNPKETTVAYRCPECGQWVVGIVGMFSLSADMLKLRCPCSGSEMSIVYTKDKKLKLTVPCFLCPNPHSFTLSSAVFFDNDCFALACPYSGMDICYMGNEEKVREATEESDETLRELAGEAGFELFKNEKAENELFLSDPQILEIVNFVIRDLDETGAITCKCPPDEGCYSVEVTADGIEVSCECCGAKTIVPVTSTLTAQAFLNCDHLELV